MIQIHWIDHMGRDQFARVESIKLWEARGGGREHPDGTVIEGYRDGHGVIQLDQDDWVGQVYITEVKA
jgi:hypothetical protein